MKIRGEDVQGANRSITSLEQAMTSTHISTTLSPASTSHIMELIFGNTDFQECLALRAVLRATKEEVDRYLVKHIIVQDGRSQGIHWSRRSHSHRRPS